MNDEYKDKVSLALIADAIKIVQRNLEDAQTEEDFELAFNTLDTLDCQFEDKADAYAKVIKHENFEIALIDLEIARLRERKKSKENNIDRMKNRLMVAAKEIGKPKFKTPLFGSFSIRQTTPIVLKVPESELPDKYFKVERTLQKSMVNDDFKAGITEYAEYGEPKEYMFVPNVKVDKKSIA